MGDWPLLNTLKAFKIHTSPKFNKTMEDLRTEAWQINFTPYACTYSVSSLLSPLEHLSAGEGEVSEKASWNVMKQKQT